MDWPGISKVTFEGRGWALSGLWVPFAGVGTWKGMFEDCWHLSFEMEGIFEGYLHFGFKKDGKLECWDSGFE